MEFDDRTIFQTKEWIRFIADAQRAEPVIAHIMDGQGIVGTFSGLIVNKLGLRILGSPLPGWSTSYMGFTLAPTVSRSEALRALENFALHELNCVHLEIMDRRITAADFDATGFTYKQYSGFEIDLTRTEEELWMAMDPSCRRCIKKSVREGVRVEIGDPRSFAEEYFSQLKDVFAKQHLVPTYGKERVCLLLKHLLPTGNLLLLKASDSRGKCIATGIFPALNDTMYFWGGASWREYQHLRPNEALQWCAIRYWKAKNIVRYDMGGDGAYKRKYGGAVITVPWGRKSKYQFLEAMRSANKNIVLARQRVLGAVHA
jgi:predicted N-acyltransferase